MRVVSQLANMTMTVGKVYREGHNLVVTNEGGEGMPTKVYVRPSDVFGSAKAIFTSLSALGFLLLLPWHYFQARGDEEKVTGLDKGKNLNNPWK